jgi:hypothetical protein
MVTTRALPKKTPGPASQEGTGEVPPQESPAKGNGKGASSANPGKGKGSPPKKGTRSSKRGNGGNGNGAKAKNKKDGEFESWLQRVILQYIETT